MQSAQGKLSLSEISLAIACPMANEGADGVRFVSEVLKYCEPVGSTSFFAVIDNVTRDNTRELLEAYAKQDPRLVVVWAPENRCVVDAYMRGYREALASGADWILEIDAGFSHRPEEIPRFFQPMLDGCDCAFGSRFMRGGRIENSSLKRRIVSYGGTLLTNLLIGTKMYDMTSGFEMFTRETLEMVLEKGIHSRAHFFQTEIKIHCRGLKFVEVPITYQMASPGLSSGPLNEAFVQLWRLFKLRITGKLDQPSPTTECLTRPAL
ncbi:MAG: glycosyltransferase [Acidobacteriaceae bacterium]|nr:glycosyltransferase [Acidobacteriaceae bacterium]